LEVLLNREIQLLRDIKHQNVISCLDVLMTANNCYIVTEYCPQGDLGSIIAKKGTFFMI
jgi:serine/threonine protein kinase